MYLDLKVHLVFNGNCEEAFNTYSKAFGGKIVFLFRKGDDKSIPTNEAEKNKISHIVLNADKLSLQGEDAPAGEQVITGSSKLVLVFKEMDKLQRVFETLSDGGTVVTPLGKTFFTEAIGEVVDKFGIRWLIMMTDEAYKG